MLPVHDEFEKSGKGSLHFNPDLFLCIILKNKVSKDRIKTKFENHHPIEWLMKEYTNYENLQKVWLK